MGMRVKMGLRMIVVVRVMVMRVRGLSRTLRLGIIILGLRSRTRWW
jgi:hypothetical protein